MSSPEFEEKHFAKYLNLLGVQRKNPNLDSLKEIVRAQVLKIPFENISKLYYKKKSNLKQLIEFKLYLEGIEKYGFGGTCYAINFYLNKLLSWLGYDVKLCGADMKTKDVHIVNIVNIDGMEYLVDAGYAAPFSEPLPLYLKSDYSIISGNDRYNLKPKDTNNHSVIELFRNNTISHGYKLNPETRNIAEFTRVIADSFNENATFMNTVLLTHFESELFLTINNMTIIESRGPLSKTITVKSLEELASEIDSRFGIPKAIVLESLSGIKFMRDAWD